MDPIVFTTTIVLCLIALMIGAATEE